VHAARSAASNSAATSSGWPAVRARFVIDATIGMWSSSWREPVPQRPWGARPPMMVTGDPLNQAVVIALIPFVTPARR